MEEIDESQTGYTSLYSKFSSVYKTVNPVSRILVMFKIVQVVDPAQRRKDKEKEKQLNINTIPNFINEFKGFLSEISKTFNIMLIFVGTQYCFAGIENSTENIIKLLNIYKEGTKMVEQVHIINFNEECPCSVFPAWYKYEGEVYDKDSNIYKDVTPAEKGWKLYDNFFCKLGQSLTKVIHSEGDFEYNKQFIEQEENNYVKFLPTSNEIEVFEGNDYMSLKEFFEIYLDELDVEFDNEQVYPYYWPINI